MLWAYCVPMWSYLFECEILFRLSRTRYFHNLPADIRIRSHTLFVDKPSIIEAKCVILYDMNTLSRALLIFIGIIGTSCAPLITICCEPHDTLIIVDDLIRGEGIVKYQPQRGQKIIKVQCTRDTLNFHEYYIQVSKKITFHNIYLTNL